MKFTVFFSACLTLVLSGLVSAQQPDRVEYSSGVVNRDHPRQLLWGDTHLHTNLSADAFMENNRTLSPDDAYRFARGEVVVSSSGVKAALKTPLDFLVVADHGEFLGLFAGVAGGDKTVLSSSLGQRWKKYYDKGHLDTMFKEFQGMVIGGDADRSSRELKDGIWRKVGETADRYNQPGQFTAFIGYEWSSSPDANNLHRVVIYKDDEETASQLPPYTAVDSTDPEDLWKFLADYERESGGEILAIPHNGNLSNGLMFAPNTYSGEPITRDYAETRSRWEPLYEVTQTKGDGEAHPKLSPQDEFADYETWDTGNFPVGNKEVVKTDAMLPYEYARSALKFGLQYKQNLGVNPFQFGMIGSTDAHTSLPAVEEDNFFGKFVESEPGPERLNANMRWLGWPNNMLTSSGLAAVWATENTRASIFEAMKRREVYATTGSRISLRFFGGWDFTADDVQRPDYVDIGYQKGVPMGAELTDAPSGKTLTFMISAGKDPIEANLDRVQVVKGWLDESGTAQEKVFDVALSDGRQVDPATGKAPPLASTVDIASASYRNSVGASEFALVWQDPEFNPAQAAFYYVRVLEIIKPRWTAYDAAFFDLKPRDGTMMTTQDRAYSSPIWYTP